MKLSSGKPILPRRKQIFRLERGEQDICDTIARADETLPGRPLLSPVMCEGKRLPEGTVKLGAIRHYTHEQIMRLPAPERKLERAEPAYPVEVSRKLADFQRKVRNEVAT